jgi:hypothetical protein
MTVTQETAPHQQGAQAHSGHADHIDPAAAFVPDQSRAERQTSYDVADFAIPGGREEDWRFTPVDRLGSLFQVQPTDESRLTVDISAPQGVELSGQLLLPGPAPRRPRWSRSPTRSSSPSR